MSDEFTQAIRASKIQSKVTHHLKKVDNMAGFAAENAPKDSNFSVLVKAVVLSEESDFHNFVEQISNRFLSGLQHNFVYQFLVVIHENLSADVYVNDNLAYTVEIIAKYNVKQGQAITAREIADVRRLRFVGLHFTKGDRVICCIKVGWRFGLFFDLGLNKKFNRDDLELAMGRIYRRLSFSEVYESVEANDVFDAMNKDGWFPFIELLGNDYKELSKAYTLDFDIDGKVENLLAKFDENRISRMSQRWWKKPEFLTQQGIIQSGLNSYISEDPIAASKTILTEIEGVLRLKYPQYADKKINILLEELIKESKGRLDPDQSLLLPAPFLKYLLDVLYGPFDVPAGKVSPSRHTAAHGVLKSEGYTMSLALQGILALDHMYFYL